MSHSRIRLIPALLLLCALGSAQVHPHNFDLLDVKWHVDLKSYEETGLLTGDVTNTMTVLSEPASVSFDCAKLNVIRVDVDDKPATFVADGKYLKVNLPPATKAGDKVRIHVFYDGRPGAGIYMIPAQRAYPAHTNVIYTQGEMEDNRYWLPTWDYPDDKATSEGTIEVGLGEIAISNGKLLGVQEKPDRRIFHWKMDEQHATYLISIVAGKYDEGVGFWGKIPVDFYVPRGLMDMGEPTFGHTEDIIAFYSKLTGFNYPYAKFCQSAVPDYMFGGMENITAVTQTIQALHPKSAEPVSDSTGLVAHELAHQWFGDTVTCSGWSDAWLNEGFATFLPTFWERAKNGEEAYDLGRYGTFQGGLAAHQMNSSRPVVWKGYKNALDMFDNFIYPGGASRMFMLMDQLGEAKFWKAISAYLNERKYTSLDTPMFFDSMSRASGVDLTPFMQQWFYTPAAPNLTVSESGSDLKITQPQPYFDLNFDVWTLDGGSWLKKKIHLTGADATLALGNQAGKPVLVDPRCFVMANIKSDVSLTVDQRIQLFQNAPNAGEKARILDTMLGDLTQEQWYTFAKSIKSARLQERAISRFQANEVNAAFLLELTRSSDRRLANTAIDRLSGQTKTKEITDRLSQIEASDPNPDIRETAMRTLIGLAGDEALVTKAWSKDSFGDHYRQIALNWWSEHNKDKCRELCLQTLAHPLAEPTRVQAIRLLGNLNDKPGETKVYDALTAILAESSFGAREAAIFAIGKYGNPAALPLLEQFKDHSLVFFREAYENVAPQLSAKK